MEKRRKKNIVELTRMDADTYLKMDKLPVAFMADNIRSMQNVGSLFRTADAFMIEEMILCGITGTPPHPDMSKTALGAERSVRWSYASDAVEEVQHRRRQGWKVVVLEQTTGSVELQNFIPVRGEKYMLVAGNEVQGVDQRIVEMADTVVEIPQSGTKHSLNVSVSAAIALWHFYDHIYLSAMKD